MREPTERVVNDDDMPIDVFDDGEYGFTVSNGSYGARYGLSITMNLEYVGEVPDDMIEEDVAALLEVLLERSRDRIDDSE